MFWRLSHPRQCGMDELAVSLKIDPLELRLRWYSDRNQNTNQPFSSKALGHLRRRRRTTAIRLASRACRNRHRGPRSRTLSITDGKGVRGLPVTLDRLKLYAVV
jgi:hypothetical protein